MPSLRIELNISADEMLRYYRGEARTVHAVAANGRTVQFPATALQKHVTHDGIDGTFELVYDDDHKFLALRRFSGPANGLDQSA